MGVSGLNPTNRKCLVKVFMEQNGGNEMGLVMPGRNGQLGTRS